ncbi:alpha/beta hydrolase [Actinoallomurus vinaceus]|uniref:alpha/beta fold hydrolase n=1 Tax=Actinoallomurus vinaceus TaxID=1080074 RepID=UPI0031ED2E5B
MRSWLVDIDGPVHVADFGGTGPTVILLHGLGGSHANWLRVGARLARIGRVFCPDLPGFGRTRLAGRDSSLEANQDVVSRLIDALGAPPVLLVGNSMGATIALRVAAARPGAVAGLALIAPWAPLAGPADPGMRTILQSPSAVRALLRTQRTRPPATTLRHLIRLGCARPDRIPPEVLSAATRIARDRAALSRAEDGFGPALASLMEYTQRPAVLRATVGGIEVPALIMRGTRDRVVPAGIIDSLRDIRPDWTYHQIEGVGHVPQFEAPEEVARIIIDWALTKRITSLSAT